MYVAPQMVPTTPMQLSPVSLQIPTSAVQAFPTGLPVGPTAYPTLPSTAYPTLPSTTYPTLPSTTYPVAPSTLQVPQQLPLTKQQQWKKKYPAILSCIFSFLEFVITLVIIGCEIGSMLIDIVTATIYVGLWASLFFIVAFISETITSTCCRNRGFATFTLLVQLVALFFAACVIGFDSFYLVSPSTCFFSTSICQSNGTTRGIFYSESNFNNIKMSLIKGQLAAGCVMFVLCLIFIIIYIITTIRVRSSKLTPNVYPQPAPAPAYSFSMMPSGPDGLTVAPPITSIRPPKPGSPLYHRPTIVLDNGDGRGNDLLCPTCSTMMSVQVRKRPPQ